MKDLSANSSQAERNYPSNIDINDVTFFLEISYSDLDPDKDTYTNLAYANIKILLADLITGGPLVPLAFNSDGVLSLGNVVGPTFKAALLADLGGVKDGNKGDVVVSDSGLTWRVPVLEQKSDEVNAHGKVLRSPLTSTLELLPFTNERTDGFYNANSGIFITSASRRSRLYSVSPSDVIYMTGSILSNVTALAVFFDASMNYLGYQFKAPASTSYYVRQLITCPAGTKYIGTSGSGGNFIIAEKPVDYYREDVAWSGGSLKTIADLDALISKGVETPRIAFSGDSITAEAGSMGYRTTVAAKLKASNMRSVAFSGARWSKTTRMVGEVAVTTQNYDDPLYGGRDSGGVDGVTDPAQMQKIVNNCVVVQVQQYIKEVLIDGLYPVPDFFYFAAGTNTEYSGSGDVAIALAGKSIDRDNTYSMANAVRWSIQSIMTAFPTCKVFVILPIQKGSANSTNILVPKVSVIRQIANYLNAIVLDGFNNSGISEIFEVHEGAGRDLRDGVHLNMAGALKYGTWVANETKKATLIV